jgi:adenylate kinase
VLLILFGIQGSGKGTQGQLLSRRLSIPHISTGEILRTLSLQKTPEGEKLKAQLDHGDYLSDERMTNILQHHLPPSVILDGYPRTLPQARMLDGIEHVDRVLFIDLPEEAAYQRALSRGRHDDTPEAIRRRMHQYRLNEEPILQYYRDQGKLVVVNGDQPIEDVFAEICAKLHI